MTQPTTLTGQTVQPSNLLQSYASMIKRLVVGTLLINLFVFALAGLSIYQSRLQYQERAEITTQNLARVLEANIDGDIDKIDVALLSVQDEVKRETASGSIDAKALNLFLAQQQEHQPEALSLRVTNAEGVAKYGIGVPAIGGPNNSDREYFIRARDESPSGLIVTKPVFTRLDKKWAIVLARRLSTADGSFAGAVYINVTLEHFSKTFSDINVGQHGSVTLRDRDLGLVVRHPAPENFEKAIGSKPSLEGQKMMQADRSSGTFLSRNPLDNVERTLSYRRIPNKPFYIIVGVAQDDYLAVWRKETVRMMALMSLFFLGTLLSSWLIYRFWKRQAVATETIREQKEFLNTILESEPECVKVIAPNGELLQMNRAGLAMLEVDSILEAKKLGLLNFVLPEYRDAFIALCQRVFSGESGSLEFLTKGKKGTPRWLETHATPLRNPVGEVTALVAVSRDITLRKQAELAIKQLNENLEERVKAEVAKNMEKERLLIQQSRLAAMGEMIGNIAHQWRQPINELALVLANIKDAYEYNDLTKEYLDSMVGNGRQLIQNMSSTIDDFRNFFKPNKEKQSFRACDCVEEAIKLVSESFKNGNIDIAIEKSGVPCNVMGYPNEFAQVVLNALSNAKEAIVEKKICGKVHIRVEQGADTATISIRDNGGGIPEEILPKVFDPYFTTKEKGTGIGLYMSKMIMDNMAGSIVIRNVEDGAEVLLTLPLAMPASV